MNVLKWLEDWYANECNGDWEHGFGIKIETLDNPVWNVTIDLEETALEDVVIPYQYFEKQEGDFYGFKIENKQYNAFGDPSKLEFLLLNFQKIVEDTIRGPEM
ncbi:immunity 53 family protein [Cytophagaceae bacterium YF14B1]|uniref:Immunity 53 family protein n=1 Tax=Xanthocytophaga flava TaxID=3048013 RepID=A0AAE3U7U8_9BACT|nr:immunity 53 family protein [Xanthocytophaga flavus]MDJ1482791.1 immunity 53 family protein [Xanthocytophaga flavus]